MGRIADEEKGLIQLSEATRWKTTRIDALLVRARSLFLSFSFSLYVSFIHLSEAATPSVFFLLICLSVNN